MRITIGMVKEILAKKGFSLNGSETSILTAITKEKAPEIEKEMGNGIVKAEKKLANAKAKYQEEKKEVKDKALQDSIMKSIDFLNWSNKKATKVEDNNTDDINSENQ